MKRQVTIALGIAIIAGGIGIMKFLEAQATPPEKKSGNTDAPVVMVKKLYNNYVNNEIAITGKLIAENRVEIFSEVQGVLLASGKQFKEGVQFGYEERMLKIDSTEYYLNLLASKSSYLNALVQLGPDIKYDFPEAYDEWNRYVASIDVTKPLLPLPKVNNEKHKNFLTSRDVYKQFYAIKSQEEKLTKYNLRAPFSGVLCEGNLQPGTMIRVGQKLGTFIQSGSYELEAAVSLNNANLIQVGDSVLLTSEDVPKTWVGKVKRLSQHIDQTSQTVKLYVSVNSTDLREGMYLSGSVLSGGFSNAVKIPRELLIGVDQLYLVNDSNLALEQVNVLKIGESEVVVDGLKNEQFIMNQVFSSAFNGMKVSPKQIKD
ncbi:MAG: hypothetical protein CL840_05655 [Crocinitomicaceae bacterium]|nr:hypothetical protein [Crocinitomicaceae bacterium]|tara:strand:+ start:614 stop:1732 length:1119 start_codon:yes stop_codon:yes gene_type:complete